MTKEELIELVNEKDKAIPTEVIPEALQIFRGDAFRGKSELFECFCQFARRVSIDKNKFSAKDYHTVIRCIFSMLLEICR